MSDFTIEQLEALKKGTTPGPWVITPHQNPVGIEATRWYGIPMERANADLAEAAPALVDALIAEKRAHQALRSCLNDLRGTYGEEFGTSDEWNKSFEHAYKEVARDLARILEADNG